MPAALGIQKRPRVGPIGHFAVHPGRPGARGQMAGRPRILVVGSTAFYEVKVQGRLLGALIKTGTDLEVDRVITVG